MRIEHLAEFVDLAATLSYTETAERLLMSESALSRHIKALEADLGIALFERSSRRVRLSEQGAWLLPRATEISRQWADVERGLREARTQAGATVSLGANYYLGDLLALFAAQREDVSVRLTSPGRSSDVLLQRLLQADHDFVVVVDPHLPAEHADRIGCLLLTVDSYVAALPRTHRLAGAEAIDPAELAGEHFISFPVDSVGDREIKDICQAAGFDPNIIFSSEVGSSIATFVRDGLGVSLLRRKSIRKTDTGGVAYVDLDPPWTRDVMLCWDLRRPLTPPAATFLAFVRGFLAEHPDGL